MTRTLAHALALLLAGGALATTAAAAPARQPTTTILRGAFTDTAKYTGSGPVSVTRRAGVRRVKIGRSFRADPRSVRLRLYLATDSSGRTFVDLGPLAETGAQSYRVPASVNFSRFRYAIAWCAAVGEPIAQAKLVKPRR